MGRPKKSIESFLHETTSSKTLFILENLWGNDGYAFWYKLQELLCSSEGHFYDYSLAENKIYLCAVMRMDAEKVSRIIECLIDAGELDRELWQKKQILWCQTFADRLYRQSARRAGNPPEKPESDAKSKKTEATKKAAAEKPKKAYGEYVKMTEDEYSKLVNLYGEKMTARMIQVLDNYKGQNGKTYKNDYRAILNWVVERVQKETGYEMKEGGGYGSGNFRPSDGFRKE